MEFLLMHKNIAVAKMDLDGNGTLSKVQFNPNTLPHLPVGGSLNLMKFHDWWKDRAIPKSRKGAAHALRELGFPSTNSLLVNNLALSLTDCYWIKPVNVDLYWEQVSLFRNNFIDIFGDLTFDTSKKLDLRNKTIFKFASSQGELQKKWCIDEYGNRFLVKGNWGSSYQQSLNEILATEIHKRQNIVPYTEYNLTSIDVEGNNKGIGCYSYNFCNESLEFVSAWELLQLRKIKQNISLFHPLVDICINNCGFSEDYVYNFLGYEIMTDFIVTNTDRHMNNIGVLRNPDTLEYICFAPIYDTGNSMFFRSSTVPTGNFLDINTHSFIKKEVKLLQYVKNRNLIDLSKLPDDNFIRALYLKDIPERHQRIEALLKAFHNKISYLDKFQSGIDIWKNY